MPPPDQPDDGAPPPIGDAIASTAGKLVGANAAAIVPFLRQNGQSLDAIHQNWCAAFVNATLTASGVPGVQGPSKNIATSFLNWGTPAEGELQPGDVLVQPKGRQAGIIGGHVGIATGHIAQGNGQTYVLMQSGNYGGNGGTVAYSWEPADSLVVRRAPQPSQRATQ